MGFLGIEEREKKITSYPKSIDWMSELEGGRDFAMSGKVQLVAKGSPWPPKVDNLLSLTTRRNPVQVNTVYSRTEVSRSWRLPKKRLRGEAADPRNNIFPSHVGR